MKIVDDMVVFAVANGKLDVVKLLLDNFRDPNSRDKEGNTGPTLAAEYGHRAVVDLLLANGSDSKYNKSEED